MTCRLLLCVAEELMIWVLTKEEQNTQWFSVYIQFIMCVYTVLVWKSVKEYNLSDEGVLDIMIRKKIL
jgi:hypothetical protein